MATQVSKVGDDTTLTTCKKTGVYEISGSRFRFREGARMPVTAKIVEAGERQPKRQTVAGNRLMKQAGGKRPSRKKAEETEQDTGDEPTE